MNLFNIHHGAHCNGAASGAVGILNSLRTQDCGTRGEIWAFDTLNQRIQQFLVRGLRVLQEPFHALSNFGEVMRGNIGGHTHRNTRRTVDQQVGNTCGQHSWFHRFTVVVRLKIYGVFVNVPHHFHGDRGHLRLGITRRSSPIITGRAKVALPKCEGVTHCPSLDQTHQCVIDSTIAVRVELTHHITDDARALIEGTVGAVTAIVHTVDNAAVHGLQTVSHIR